MRGGDEGGEGAGQSVQSVNMDGEDQSRDKIVNLTWIKITARLNIYWSEQILDKIQTFGCSQGSGFGNIMDSFRKDMTSHWVNIKAVRLTNKNSWFFILTLFWNSSNWPVTGVPIKISEIYSTQKLHTMKVPWIQLECQVNLKPCWREILRLINYFQHNFYGKM